MIHKTLGYQGLKNTVTTISDTLPTSPQYLNISMDEVFSSGKNVFSLLLNTDLLVDGSEIFVEILDSENEPVYYEVTNYEDNSNAIYVAPYIYPDTAPGFCSITILATVDRDKAGNIVDNPEGTPNYKWQRDVKIIPERRNSSPILFSTDLPTIDINELVKTYMSQDYPISEYVSSSFGLVKYTLLNDVPTLQSIGFDFVPDMVDGVLNVTASDLTPTSPYPLDSNIYSTKIKEVVSETNAILEDRYEAPHTLYNPPYHVPRSFDSSSYDLVYTTTPDYSLTENSRSFAHIRLNNAAPISGEIYRVKTHIKSAGSVGGYELADDTILLDSPYREKLIDLEADNIKTSMGEILSQDVVDSYWSAGVYQINSDPLLEDQFVNNATTLTYDSSTVLPNSFNVDVDDPTIFGLHYIRIDNDNKSYPFKQGQECKLIFSAVGTASTKIGVSGGLVHPKISVFISGSAYTDPKTPTKFGKLLTILNTADASQQGTTWRYDNEEIEFLVDEDGEGSLVFVVEAGAWNISNMSLFSNMDTGFSPENINLLVSLPTEHVDDKKDIKLEFYDSYGNISDFALEYKNVVTIGGNTYIGGGYNLLTGSLFVSNGLNSGVEIKGDYSGAIIRSIGYLGLVQGKPGFMMWSGSVLSGSGDNYAGVGLEMYADLNNYFKFRTNPSKFEVKTESFYFGTPTMFVSGSNGAIEIQSGQGDDTFWLKPNGQVIIKKDNQVMLDTESGFADALNIGRFLWSLDEGINVTRAVDEQYGTSNYGPNSGSVDNGLVLVGKFKCNILPGETKFNVMYRISTTGQLARMVLRLSKVRTDTDAGHANGYFPYDEHVHEYDSSAAANEQDQYFKQYNGVSTKTTSSFVGNISAEVVPELTGSIIMGQLFIENRTNNSNSMRCDSCIVMSGREINDGGIGGSTPSAPSDSS